MEDQNQQNQKMNKSYLSLPSNYVTLAQLQQRWLNHKQQQEQPPLLAPAPTNVTAPTEDSGTNRFEPEAGAGIGDVTADLDREVADTSSKKKKKNQWSRKQKLKVQQNGAGGEGSKTAIGSEVNEKKIVDSVKVEEKVDQKSRVSSVKGKQNGRMGRMESEGGSKTAIGMVLNKEKSVDSVKVEEQAEQRFRVSSVKGKQNRRMEREGGSKTAIGMVLNEEKSVDSVKVEEQVEQKFRVLTVNTVKGNQNGRMGRMNEKVVREEGGSETAIGGELNEKKIVDSVKVEDQAEQRFRVFTVNTVKGNQNGRMSRMNEKVVREEGGSETAIGGELNEKKVVDSVKVEDQAEQRFRVFTVNTVKGNQNGRMNKVEQKVASEGGGSKTAIGSELNEKKIVDSVKVEEHVEQKFGASSGKVKLDWRVKKVNNVEQKAASAGGLKTAIRSELKENKSVDLVKLEEEAEQKIGAFLVDSVKGNHNWRVRRMNKVEQKVASEGESKTTMGSELNEKKIVESVKVEEEAEQKIGAFLVNNSVKGNHNWRMRRMNDQGFRHSQSQRNGYGGGRGYGNGYGYRQKPKSDKMVWVKRDGEIET